MNEFRLADPEALRARPGEPRTGVVVAYDGNRGLGSVEQLGGEGRGRASYRFHCTAIADGSRQIDPGTPVVFSLAAGLGGVLEARHVSPV